METSAVNRTGNKRKHGIDMKFQTYSGVEEDSSVLGSYAVFTGTSVDEERKYGVQITWARRLCCMCFCLSRWNKV